MIAIGLLSLHFCVSGQQALWPFLEDIRYALVTNSYNLVHTCTCSVVAYKWGSGYVLGASMVYGVLLYMINFITDEINL